ncbi:MAG: metal-sensitive transcriptional regulator [Anaerolineae bacterium]|nr:metal-sensitive transcriptional regulator [Anaerolineae bacterium]
MTRLEDRVRDDLILRLRRIEGQAKGIQRMVEDGRSCAEILDQLASVRAATRSASIALIRYYASTCADSPEGKRDLGSILDMVFRATE